MFAFFAGHKSKQISGSAAKCIADFIDGSEAGVIRRSRSNGLKRGTCESCPIGQQLIGYLLTGSHLVGLHGLANFHNYQANPNTLY